mgnify:CR=1 FL=1
MAVKRKRAGKVYKYRKRKSLPAPAYPFAQHAFGGQVEFLSGGGVPTVFITREAYSRMWHYVDIADEEVGWFGTVRVTKYGNYLIEEVFLGEQEVSAAQTEISGDGLAQIGQNLIDTRPDGVEQASKLFFWGHSHVRMGTSPSGQDEKQMDEFRENGCPWFIRGILNKLGRMEFTIFLWEAGVKIVDVPWAIYEHVDESIRAGIEAEFKAKVTRAVYKYMPPAVAANMHQPWFAGAPGYYQGNNGSGVMVVHSGDLPPGEQGGFNNVG